jgi:DoxX-like family
MFIAVSFMLAAACLIPATGKLMGNPKMQASAAHFGIAWERYRLIGVAELAAAVGVLAGLYWRPLGVAAGAGDALLLLGAAYTHLRAHDNGRDLLPVVGAMAIDAVYLAVALNV